MGWVFWAGSFESRPEADPEPTGGITCHLVWECLGIPQKELGCVGETETPETTSTSAVKIQ